MLGRGVPLEGGDGHWQVAVFASALAHSCTLGGLAGVGPAQVCASRLPLRRERERERELFLFRLEILAPQKNQRERRYVERGSVCGGSSGGQRGVGSPLELHLSADGEPARVQLGAEGAVSARKRCFVSSLSVCFSERKLLRFGNQWKGVEYFGGGVISLFLLPSVAGGCAGTISTRRTCRSTASGLESRVSRPRARV